MLKVTKSPARTVSLKDVFPLNGGVNVGFVLLTLQLLEITDCNSR